MLLSPSLVAGAPVAQLDRASASGAEGHRFKSCQAHQQTSRDISRTQISATHIPGGPLAQLVEQLTLNQRAVGSTPTRPTKFLNNSRILLLDYVNLVPRFLLFRIQQIHEALFSAQQPFGVVIECARSLVVANLLGHIEKGHVA